jgi:hypothetical protein
MALGETIGYGTRLTMNNDTLYKSHANLLTRCVIINLLGDPALRMEVVAPPGKVTATSLNGVAALSWTGSADQITGYHVYRSAERLGPYTRLTIGPVTGTSYVDTTPFQSSRYYMVRALALQNNPSGSYYNLSQGSFTAVTVSGTTPPPPATNAVKSSVTMTSEGPRITWNSTPGSAYHVEGMVLIYNNDWVNISGRIVAGSDQTSFTDSDWIWYWTRYYRIIRE